MKERKNLFEQNILVVDDEAVNRELLGSILETSYKIIYANNGEEALEIIEKREILFHLYS